MDIIKEDDAKFMRRCLDLAAKAGGQTYPNPVVGSVIVHKGRIIGEGYHLKSGGPHAEVLAINSVRERSLLTDSTIYVSLEPCSHFGKTPPCVDLIISSGIPRVVVGTMDTSEKVAGNGLAKLSASGLKVKNGVLEEECRWINRRFFTVHEKKRPYIILKWAQSADGFIDTDRPKEEGTGPYWITGKPERILVHRWRSQEAAILAGAGTIRTDHPSLNVRHWAGSHPVKIILSASGKIEEYLAGNETNGTVIVFSYRKNPGDKKNTWVKLDKNIPSAVAMASWLFEMGVQSVLVEGGAMTINHFVENDLWDEARIFTGRTFFNKGVRAPLVKGKLIDVFSFENSKLEKIVNV